MEIFRYRSIQYLSIHLYTQQNILLKNVYLDILNEKKWNKKKVLSKNNNAEQKKSYQSNFYTFFMCVIL